MRTLGDWLGARAPAQPEKLRELLRERSRATRSGQAPDVGGFDPVDALADAGRDGLEHALARVGRVRESAFKLLEADALFTFACEAALEAEDPRAALRRILTVAGS
jgi:hypothetical protein